MVLLTQEAFAVAERQPQTSSLRLVYGTPLKGQLLV
jgi:hypothetical protein